MPEPTLEPPGGRAPRSRSHLRPNLPWVLATAGGAGAIVAAALAPRSAQSAAAQLWPPFVLVAGLLMIGLVAADDQLFTAAGQRLSLHRHRSWLVFIGATVLIAVVSAVLNLDSSVAFLTPVLIYTARHRGDDEAPLLYGCLLLSNAASLLLPGSNLTNLIVLGHLHLAGAHYFARMAPVWIVAVAVTAVVVAISERKALKRTSATSVRRHDTAPPRVTLGPGLATVAAAVVLVVVLRSPALPVLAVGVAATALHLARRRTSPRAVLDVVGLPVLVGLYGVAVALGAAGRAWSGPTDLLSHLDRFGTAAFAAAAAVAVNNLPAASLLGARTPRHPFALLIGLNLGPNLFVTGSLSWILWLRAAKLAKARPSIKKASLLGVIAVPLSIAAATGVLAVTRW